MNLRPMLAGKAPEDLERLRFPLIASPKLDGIRCLIKDGVALSRTLKPIRNRHIQSLIGRPEYNGFDGELIVGSPTDPNCMQHTSSGVMSFAGEPDFRYYVFDRWDHNLQPFQDRFYSLGALDGLDYSIVQLHYHEILTSVPMIESMEKDVLEHGYEGLILRDPHGPYKFNRSTTKEGWMLKLKRFAQDEAIVIGVEELLHNANAEMVDELGYTQRSQAKEYLIPTGKLGALVCRLLVDKQPTGCVFNIGTGFDDFQRSLPLADWIGKVVTFKHFAQQGVLEKPRHPVFISVRDIEDL